MLEMGEQGEKVSRVPAARRTIVSVDRTEDSRDTKVFRNLRLFALTANL